MKHLAQMTTEERYAYNRTTDHPGGGEMLTKQADKDAADINIIVKTYGTSNEFLSVNPNAGIYMDSTQVPDLVEAKTIWNDAVAEFDKLPAEVRALANNDPITYVEMLHDEDARRALIKRGLPIKEIERPDALTLLETIRDRLPAPETQTEPE